MTAGDRARAGQIFSENIRYIESTAALHAHKPDFVSDIVQQVGERICRHLNGYRGDAEIRTWLYRITVNEARSVYRRELRLERGDVTLFHNSPSRSRAPRAHDRVAGRELRERLVVASRRLSQREQRLMCDLLPSSRVQQSEPRRKQDVYRLRQKLREIIRNER